MRTLRVLSLFAVAGLVSGAWAFDLTTSFASGYLKSAGDVGGTVVLDDAITKVDSGDPVIGVFANLVAGSQNYSTATVGVGTEVSGIWDVNQFQAQLYGFDGTQAWKFYGSAFGSMLTSTEDLTTLRYAWLAAGWSGGVYSAYAWFASDYPFFYSADQEAWAHGTDLSGNYTYSVSTNIGFGYAPSNGGTYSDNYWMLAYDDTIDPNTGYHIINYRGGLHYSDTAYLVAVPEPTTLLLGAGLLALVARRKRR